MNKYLVLFVVGDDICFRYHELCFHIHFHPRSCI